MNPKIALFSLAGVALLGPTATAQNPEFLQSQVFDSLTWREVGPVNFCGRVVDIAVNPERKATWWVATGSGGIFKTTNNGASFEAQFQNEGMTSIGDIAVAPSDPDVLYVGTGEANNQRSSYWGNGVHRTTDGGKTWTHVGLEGTDHIGRIVVHPDNADVAWVAALGALYSPNEERGLYKTTDGGKTWERTGFVNADVGFVDVAIDPENPDNLLAASYERRRRAWDFSEDGPGSAIWRSTNGGDTWRKVTAGLPSGKIGRIGLDYFGGGGEIAFAVVENNNPRTGPSSRRRSRSPDAEAEPKARPDDPEGLYPFGEDEVDEAPQARVAAARPVGGEIFRTDDGGKTWKKVNGSTSIGGSPGYYYGQIRVDPSDADRLYVLSVPVLSSSDGGKTWTPRGRRGGQSFGSGLHVDHHALWIDPDDGEHCLLGNDGGISQTWDRGANWDYLDHLPVGQFYAVEVDNREPYWIYGGTQDNGTWGVPSRTMHGGGNTVEAAVKIGGGDGFQVAIDPQDPNVVYYESQFGNLRRRNLATGANRSIRPRSSRGKPSLRFNWMSPIEMSPHDGSTLYFGSQYVHKTVDRGNSWQRISDDLTTTDPDRLKGDVPHCTITTIAESPVRRGVLWVGTDDGRVWTTRNDGGRWEDVTDRFAGVPPSLWVSRVEASPHDANTAFVTFTGYREDIREPYVFMTTDGGDTFLDIGNNLPKSPVNVIRQHPRVEDTLLVGNESGVHVSVDSGASWYALGGNLPHVPVHDLVVHPRESDIVIGTHGRGMFVLDAEVLEEFTGSVTRASAHVFAPRDAVAVGQAPNRGYVGARAWSASNPSASPRFFYFLANDLEADLEFEVLNAEGGSAWRWTAQDEGLSAGLHSVRMGARAAGGNSRLRNVSRGRTRTTPGHYALIVKRDDEVIARYPFQIRSGGDLPDAPAAGHGYR